MFSYVFLLQCKMGRVADFGKKEPNMQIADEKEVCNLTNTVGGRWFHDPEVEEVVMVPDRSI